MRRPLTFGPNGVFWRNRQGASAVEFSLVALPFVLLMLFLVQLGLYFVYKMALDTAVLRQSEQLAASFSTNATPVLLTSATLQQNMLSLGGGLVTNASALSAEVQPLSNLDSAVTPVSTSLLVNEGSAQTVLAVRATYTVPVLIPGFSNQLSVSSSALVRRQNQ